MLREEGPRKYIWEETNFMEVAEFEHMEAVRTICDLDKESTD